MTPLILALFTGCTADYTSPALPPAPSYQDPGLASTGAGPVHALASLEGTYALPDDSRPGHDAIQTVFELELTQSADKRYTATLPFSIGTPRGYPPAGIKLTVDGNTAPFGERGGRRWSGSQRSLELQWPSLPEKVEIAWPDLEQKLARRSFAESGRSPEDFVRWSVTHAGETRQGLLLPAPATAEWDLTIPPSNPTFSSWLAMDHTPLPGDLSDGATAVLEVVHEGTQTEVARQSVRGDAKGFSLFKADLSAFAGEQVTVKLRTDPGTNSDHDYLFWGSPTIWGAPSGPVRRVVVIGIDTTRPDHFGFHGYDKPTSPELDAIAANSAIFDRAWTPAPRTRPSFRSATTGRNPLDAVGAKNIGEVFQEQGFATAGVVANVHLQPRFGFHNGFDLWLYDNGAKAEEQVDRTLAFMKSHEDRDTYVFMHLLDPHIFYGAPGAWRNKFVTTSSDLPDRINRWGVYKLMEQGKLSDDDKAYLEGLYDGEIAYTSYQLGRFFHELDKLGGNTLVVVHSDHGEEFWEHGGFEHNHSLYDDTTRALLMVRPGPGFEGGRRIDAPATLADIAPTLYDYAGFDPESLPPVDGRSLRPLIEGAESGPGWRERPVAVGHLRYGHERWGVVHNHHKYVLHTGTGHEELYDLSADPGEQNNLAASGRPLGPWRNALADSHQMPVCPGLRIAVEARPNGEPFAIALPEVPLAVQILDPERAVQAPANQAWGLPPTRRPEEIGAVHWEPGSAEFTWDPGDNPRDGQIFVFYDKPVDVAKLAVTHPSVVEARPLRKTPQGWVWTSAGQRLVATDGVVLSPPVGEAERMRLLRNLDSGAAGGDDLAMLQELGYLGDDHGHDEPSPDAGSEPDPTPPTDGGSDGTGGSEAPPAAANALRAQACRW